MKLSKLLLLIAGSAWSLASFAQWQWVDNDGRKVFSDRPPPASVPQSKIVQSPKVPLVTRATLQTPEDLAAASAAAAAVTAEAQAEAKNNPKPTAKELEAKKEADAKKVQQEAAEAAQKKAIEEKNAKNRADNCARAKTAKNNLNSGRLMSRTNEKGQMGFMDDAARQSELKRMDEVISSDCKG